MTSNPLRFGCFALLPLPHIAETLEFISEIKANTVLRPDGFGISTSIGNLHEALLERYSDRAQDRHYLGDPMFEPLWEALDNISSTVFIHPTDSVMPPNLAWRPCMLALVHRK